MLLLRPSGTLERRYGAIRLHLDDLEQVVALLRQADLTVTISDSLYEYDDLTEVADKRGPRPRTLHINGRKQDGSSDIALRIDGYQAELRSDRALELVALSHQLETLLESHTSPVLEVLHPVAWAAAAGIAYFLQASGWRIRTGDGKDMSWLFPVAFLVLALISIGSRKAFGGVSLKRRHEGGFFRRNADRLWLVVIGALLGTAVTEIVQAILR